MPQTAPTKDLNFTNVMRVLTAPVSAIPQLLFPFLHPYPLRYSTKISPVNNSRLASQCSNKRYCLFLYIRGERWSSLHEEDMSVEAGQRWASFSKYPCWESKGRVLGGHFKRYSSEYIVLSKKRAWWEEVLVIGTEAQTSHSILLDWSSIHKFQERRRSMKSSFRLLEVSS